MGILGWFKWVGVLGWLELACPTACEYLFLPPNPRLWCRYVDDTFVIQKEVNKQNFLQHINSVDQAIQFTVENNKEDGATPSWIPL